MKLRNKKTGETVVIDSFKIETPLMQAEIESLEGLNDIVKELNDEWEDYKPAEPLIKDDKIRKAVRAWAESNLIKKVKYEYVEHEGSYFSEYSCSVRFYEDLHLTNRREYALDELCGEEE